MKKSSSFEKERSSSLIKWKKVVLSKRKEVVFDKKQFSWGDKETKICINSYFQWFLGNGTSIFNQTFEKILKATMTVAIKWLLIMYYSRLIHVEIMTQYGVLEIQSISIKIDSR